MTNTLSTINMLILLSSLLYLTLQQDIKKILILKFLENPSKNHTFAIKADKRKNGK